MFLKCEPNPHQNGRMTRAMMMEFQPGSRFAIDAETLHKQPHLLNAFSRFMHVRIRILDALAYLCVLLGVLGSISFAWWLFIPGLALCIVMLAIIRRTAGNMARKAARRSTDDFRALHDMGCLWFVYA